MSSKTEYVISFDEKHETLVNLWLTINCANHYRLAEMKDYWTGKQIKKVAILTDKEDAINLKAVMA